MSGSTLDRVALADPIVRRRKAGLGRYHATRSEWREAYWEARMDRRAGREANSQLSGVRWKAGLIVAERGRVDPLAYTPKARVAAARLIEEILAEPDDGAESARPPADNQRG